MTHNPVDVSSRVSPRLSALMRSRVEDPDSEYPVTLRSVRRFLSDLLPEDFREAEQRHRFDIGDSPLDELDLLIDEFGEDALAVDFVQASASEALSSAIERMFDGENPPTLGSVREAILSGLGARLVGDGLLEDDEDDTLLAEVESLIEQYGADTSAEAFLLYE